MNEYRTLLADRLLTRHSPKFDIDRESRNLELLRMRFGEGQLHNCEVMLKDMRDSKKINEHVHEDQRYLKGEMEMISGLMLLFSQYIEENLILHELDKYFVLK